jgi:poly(3-hydroxybutyrate) depolymerase
VNEQKPRLFQGHAGEIAALLRQEAKHQPAVAVNLLSKAGLKITSADGLYGIAGSGLGYRHRHGKKLVANKSNTDWQAQKCNGIEQALKK